MTQSTESGTVQERFVQKMSELRAPGPLAQLRREAADYIESLQRILEVFQKNAADWAEVRFEMQAELARLQALPAQGGAVTDQELAALDAVVVYYMSNGWPSYSDRERTDKVWTDEKAKAQSAALARHLERTRSLPSPSPELRSPGRGNTRGEIITQIIRDVAELPDRTSPEDQPEMMLVSCDELEGILESRLPAEQGAGEPDANTIESEK